MTAYINVGAYINGERPKSKKAVREAVRDHPETVVFDLTSALGPGGTIRATAADIGTATLVLVGPDPYTRRNFYGNVTATSRGIKVA